MSLKAQQPFGRHYSDGNDTRLGLKGPEEAFPPGSRLHHKLIIRTSVRLLVYFDRLNTSATKKCFPFKCRTASGGKLQQVGRPNTQVRPSQRNWQLYKRFLYLG